MDNESSQISPVKSTGTDEIPAGMTDVDKERIVTHFRFLHEYIQGALPALAPGLIEKKVFTPHMMDDIMSEKSSHQQSMKLLKVLPTRGPLAWGLFIDCIKEVGDNFVVDHVHPGYVKKAPPATQPVEVPSEKVEIDPDDENSLEVKVTPCRGILCGQDIYKNDSSPKGLAIIINIVKFVASAERLGSTRDTIRLQSLYTELGYEVIVKTNLKAQEIMDFLKEIAGDARHKAACSCIITILSHGDENGIYGRDSERVLLKYIFQRFDNKNCLLLQNKPKLFVIQACRGDRSDSALLEKSDSSTAVPDVIPVDVQEPITLPVRSDMLIVYSTLLDYVSLRHVEKGSRFICTLISVLSKNAWKDHAADLFTSVNRQMKDFSGPSPMKQQSEYQSNFIKKLYFFPGMKKS